MYSPMYYAHNNGIKTNEGRNKKSKVVTKEEISYVTLHSYAVYKEYASE